MHSPPHAKHNLPGEDASKKEERKKKMLQNNLKERCISFQNTPGDASQLYTSPEHLKRWGFGQNRVTAPSTDVKVCLRQLRENWVNF